MTPRKRRNGELSSSSRRSGANYAATTAGPAAAVEKESSPEAYEVRNSRNLAARILQSYEKLAWHAVRRCETIAQTRLHFQNVIAGFQSEDEAELVYWKTDITPHPRVLSAHDDQQVSGSASGTRNDKGKQRVGSGGTSNSWNGGVTATAGRSALRQVNARNDMDVDDGHGFSAGGVGVGTSGSKKRKSDSGAALQIGRF